MQVNSQYLSYVSTFSGVRTGIKSSPADECDNSGTSSFANKLSEKSRIYEPETENNRKTEETAINPEETATSGEPTYHWYDGQYGYHAYVYRNDGSGSEYTVKLQYNDGRCEERLVDVDSVDGSNCNFIDLSVRMHHLKDEGKLDQKDVMMNLVSAHYKMEYSMPDADMNTNINFRSWYEQQLKLNMNNTMSPRGVQGLLDILKWL
ncbi:hypothetical protein [Butyrivibrio sp. INlla16]|uniref:hypothetical protein n=1 Tax=Butyrivibrio sp. INlla16 TaxID=1520807 RepID=UPI00088A6EC4|nr:hypothetical protein [Butyrivibrio sp. INlla16]SDB04068.1 hypothetical protein SAMN02910263_00153 [Butyrivibrio sp. INlla16]